MKHNKFKKRNKFVEDKVALATNMHKTVADWMNDYNVYFSTFTFGTNRATNSPEDYQEFFRLFRKKLDRYLLSHPKAYYTKPTLYLIPEESFGKTKQNMDAKIHYHGFMSIHKKTEAKFRDKLIVGFSTNEENQVRTNLSEKLLFPYPVAAYKNLKNTRLLNIDECEFYLLNSQLDAMHTCFYCFKNFVKGPFTPDDIIVENKLQSRPGTVKNKKYHHQHQNTLE